MQKFTVTTVNSKDDQKISNSSLSRSTYDYEMIVFCHLRWGFVYQRPQHLISRMAKHYKILFVEEPIPFKEGEENTYELEVINNSLHIVKPKVRNIADIRNVLRPLLKKNQIDIGWWYSASFSPLIGEFKFKTIIYDCMDELSLFKGAAPELIFQEKFLLSKADIVFTGGKSLFESKKSNHKNVFCFPSSVEREHFEEARETIEIPIDIKCINTPIVGYFGVIDERIDLELLHQTAILQPETAFVMIGPLAKIGEEDLPREKNIHYLGMKTYQELPGYIKAFDIAMMPFALNDATRFISPTKTLEYMAAGKPIISTRIKDVERDYSSCISIIETATEFSNSINQLLKQPSAEIDEKYQHILDRTSWDATANKMKKLITIAAQ